MTVREWLIKAEIAETREARDFADIFWRWRSRLLVIFDALMVFGALMLAYYLRYHTLAFVLREPPAPPIAVYLKGGALLVIVWLVLNWRGGSYENALYGLGAPVIRLRALLVNGAYAIGVFMVVSFMYRELAFSRGVYLLTGAFACAGMALTRVLFRAIDRDFAAQGVVRHHVVIAGVGAAAREFAGHLNANVRSARVVGYLEDGPESRHAVPSGRILGKLDDLAEIRRHARFDTLVLTRVERGGDAPGASIVPLLNFCEARGVTIYLVPGSFEMAITSREVASFCGVPLIRLQDAALHEMYAVVKRGMDVVVALAGIVIGLPFWAGVAAAIKLTSKGPVFFTQTRVGLHGQPFKIYKYRTMVPDAEARLKELVDVNRLAVPGFKIKNDPRVTPIGRWLRRASLDETPQLINVLKGEMSLVGPRPEMPDLVARYTPAQRRRLKAKPGMTGYLQVRARGIPLAAGIEYDLLYLKHQSLLLDLYILFRTVIVVFRGSGVTH